MAGTVYDDQLNAFIRDQTYFSAGLDTPVEKRANSYWYWRNTGLPVNVRRDNGRSGANVTASAKAAQAAKRAGPGSGPGAARAMYARLKAEVEGELKAAGRLPPADECPVIAGEQLDAIGQMVADSEAIVGRMYGGGSRKIRKQRGGAFMDQLKRVLQILCMLPRETVRVIDQESTSALRQTADTLIQDLPHTAERAAGIVTRIPAGIMGVLLVRDLGSNYSLTVRAINAIISVLGSMVNPALTMAWARGFLGNLASIVYGSALPITGIAAVVVINYEGVRFFQGVYNRLLEAAGAAPTQEQMAQAFEGTVIQFIGYLSREAALAAARRVPEYLLPAAMRVAVLDSELDAYMAQVPEAQELRRIRRQQEAGADAAVQAAAAAAGPGGAGAAAAGWQPPPPYYEGLSPPSPENVAAEMAVAAENAGAAASLTREQLNAQLAAYRAQDPRVIAAQQAAQVQAQAAAAAAAYPGAQSPHPKAQGGRYRRGKSHRRSKRTSKGRKYTRKA
jgi:hypothetical protein